MKGLKVDINKRNRNETVVVEFDCTISPARVDTRKFRILGTFTVMVNATKS